MKKSRSRQPRTKTLFFKQMRKAKPKKRLILPDPVFNDQKVSKFVNHLMYDGKKNTSYEIFYAALETVKAKLPNEEKSPLLRANRIKFLIEIDSLRSGRISVGTWKVAPPTRRKICSRNLEKGFG